MKLSIWGGLFSCGLFLVAACGDDEDGGKAATGGTGGQVGGAGGATGGDAGSGGSGAQAGSGGSGGTTACAPPTDSTKAALCLKLNPEDIEFFAPDPAFDGNGVLYVELFDTPTPSSTSTAVASTLLPTQVSDAGLTEGSLGALTAEAHRFDDLDVSGKLYARAVFLDNLAAIGSSIATPGVWLGGVDLSGGLTEDAPLMELSLTAGVGTSVNQELIALRKLSVSIKRENTLSPIGDGQGPLTFVAVDSQTLDTNSKLFGVGSLLCADLSGSSTFTVDGFVFGKGPYFVAAVLNDFGVDDNDLPAGALTNLEVAGTIPTSAQLSYAPNAYAVTASVDLTTSFPAPDAGGDNASCTTTDGGADAGPADASSD